MVGEKEEYRDKGIQEVYGTPYEEKLKMALDKGQKSKRPFSSPRRGK